MSFYTARPERGDTGLAEFMIANYEYVMTRYWWNWAVEEYQMAVSEAVLAEISQGDRRPALRRLGAVNRLPRLPLLQKCEELAKRYLEKISLPDPAITYAVHLAVASVHAVDYFVTWNQEHLANESVRRRLVETNAAWGVPTPIVCTPAEMIRNWIDEG